MHCEHDRRAFLKSFASLCAAGALGPRAGLAAAPANPDDLTAFSLTEAAALIRSRKISPVEVTNACLARIDRLNPRLNAFITVTGDSALAEARAAEAEIRRGAWRGPLHGVPIAVKDIIDTAGVRTTAASALFKDRVPEDDAEVVRRLRSAGAVLIGKLNLHEFAYGGSSIASQFGAVRNPWNPEFIAGGSSGGSGAAVAASLCFGALGTDTGGSIRLPAAHCGIVGLKPTYGRVSTRGVLPLAWSLDHIGPMTRSVADAAAMLQAIAGYDAKEPTSADRPVPDYGKSLLRRIAAVRLGVAREYATALDPEIESAFTAAVATLRTLTAGVREISFPLNSDDRTTIRAAEAFAYHAANVAATPGLYQPETLAKIRTGADISTTAYIQARRRMEQLRHDGHAAFQTVDLIVTPTTPVLPTAIAETTPDDAPRIRHVAPINLTGFPAISVPCGFSKNGLPIGLQLVARSWDEELLLAVAAAFENATNWHAQRPRLAVRTPPSALPISAQYQSAASGLPPGRQWSALRVPDG
jgi:aspartyl-tRNA(Asn)/glutamyl-tRNA(Gln) amidotransferase subunit A